MAHVRTQSMFALHVIVIPVIVILSGSLFELEQSKGVGILENATKVRRGGNEQQQLRS